MYKVAGFDFESEEDAVLAQKELQGIQYFKEQTKMDDPDVVLKLYNSLITQQVFDTPVGICFLEELQEYLRTIPYIKSEDVLPIPVKENVSKKVEKKKKPKPEKKKKTPKDDAVPVTSGKKNRYRQRYHVSLFFCIVFLAIIIGMFMITYLSGKDRVNILNYENKIIDKYESWESELQTREDELNKREKALEEKTVNE